MIPAPDRLKIFYDSEFTGLHRKTSLISLGMVTEYGDSFYAEFLGYKRSQCDEWINNNVIKNLIFKDRRTYQTFYDGTGENTHVKAKGSIREIRDIMMPWFRKVLATSGKDKIQFVSDCDTYDMMLLNDIISPTGCTIDLPPEFDYISLDICTMFFINNIDPDVNRIEFLESQNVNIDDIIDTGVMIGMKGGNTHNSLFDAAVIKACFNILYMGGSIR